MKVNAENAADLSGHLRVPRPAFDVRAMLKLQRGRVMAIVGPNGAGKSTVLRAIAGLEPSATGELMVGDQLWMSEGMWMPPELRSVGFVFQDYLLFPHLSVVENVAFGMRRTGESRTDVKRRAHDWLGTYGIADLAHQKPGQISGGQAQRVALVRALAREPKVLLLDEPLAALDAGTSARIRLELAEHLRQFSGITLLVTHNPIEALVLADDLCVMQEGAVVQMGTVAEVTHRPATSYVATLMGLNLLAGVLDLDRIRLDGGGEFTVKSLQEPGRVFASVRPSAISVHRRRPEGSARNIWTGTVGGIEQLGDRVRLEVHGPPRVLIDVTPAAVAELGIKPGIEVWMSVKATEIDVYSASTTQEFT